MIETAASFSPPCQSDFQEFSKTFAQNGYFGHKMEPLYQLLTPRFVRKVPLYPEVSQTI